VYFMHIEGEGTVEQLAGAVRKVYDKIKEIRAANPQPKDSFGAASLPEKSSISAEPLNKIFGMSSETNNGMVKFTIGRPATMHGVKIDNVMGVNTWAAFAGSDDNAVVDRDFAVTEDELQPALKAIRVGGISIVAIHSHMTHEQPRILFFHYWGRGPAKKLAEAIQGALLASGLSDLSTSAAK
jgi:molybdopterin-biosynthesis enzyme MoeA-like protein